MGQTGHPEWHHTPGVEATTGPLGQGAANAVGMAIAEKFLGNFFNRPGHQVIDHHTYALVSDGDVMEGVCFEAARGHLRLGKLTFLYDANHITLDGPLDLVMSEDVGARFAAQDWQVLHVPKGDTDLAGLDDAIKKAKARSHAPDVHRRQHDDRLRLAEEGRHAAAHGSPLGDAEVAATKQALGWDPNAKFLVPTRSAPTWPSRASAAPRRTRSGGARRWRRTRPLTPTSPRSSRRRSRASCRRLGQGSAVVLRQGDRDARGRRQGC